MARLRPGRYPPPVPSLLLRAARIPRPKRKQAPPAPRHCRPVSEREAGVGGSVCPNFSESWIKAQTEAAIRGAGSVAHPDRAVTCSPWDELVWLGNLAAVREPEALRRVPGMCWVIKLQRDEM